MRRSATSTGIIAFVAIVASASAASASASSDPPSIPIMTVYENDNNETNITASPAPSHAPSLSPMPTTAGNHTSNITSPAPSAPPSTAGGMPSSPPSISFPPTITNASHPPSTSPMPSSPPSFAPTPDSNKGGGGGGGTSFIHKMFRAIGWTIIALLGFVALAWTVTNHRRIVPLLSELCYRIRTTDWRRFFTNLASNAREVCGGLYHRVRFGRWSFRGLGGRDYDTVPLNEIVFDPHDIGSGDPTELLLSRER